MLNRNGLSYQKMGSDRCLNQLASQPLVVSKYSHNPDKIRAELFSGDMAVVYLKTEELGHAVETLVFTIREPGVSNWLALCFFDNSPHEWKKRDNSARPIPVKSLEGQIHACQLMLAVKETMEKAKTCQGCGLCML